METKLKNIKKTEPIENLIINAIESIALSCYGVRDLKNKSIFFVNKKEKNPKECITVTKSREGYRIKIYVAL